MADARDGADVFGLGAAMADGDLRLIPLVDAHIEPLRAACAEDREIWAIYPYSLLDEHFDPTMAMRRASGVINFTVCIGADVVGLTSYARPDAVQRSVEIGGTFIAPRVRGTGLNRRMKGLMIDRAFACGFRRIEMRVDERNLRSQAAVLKLGARRESLQLKDRVTWTGHVRNTCLFALTPEDWTP